MTSIDESQGWCGFIFKQKSNELKKFKISSNDENKEIQKLMNDNIWKFISKAFHEYYKLKSILNNNFPHLNHLK